MFFHCVIIMAVASQSLLFLYGITDISHLFIGNRSLDLLCQHRHDLV